MLISSLNLKVASEKRGSFATCLRVSGCASAASLLLAGVMSGTLLLSSVQPAQAFDPAKVFQEDKPSIKKLFKFYLKNKKDGKDKEALDVLEYAADQGNQTARWKLGRMYEDGDSVSRNPAKAYEFYKQIADNYGDAQPNTPEWAITGKAMVQLGHFYQTGLPEAGIEQNINEAQVMYTTSAMYFRDPDGQFELGKLLLQSGSGNPDEGRQAIRMLQLAASKGHAGALALLGHSLVEGEYVQQDVVQGLSMLTKATDIAPIKMRPWIDDLQRDAWALASEDQRKQALLAVSAQ